MSLENIVESPVGEVGGWATTGGAIILQLGHALGVDQINPWLTALLSIGGLVFVILKIKNMQLRNKILKDQIKKNDENL